MKIFERELGLMDTADAIGSFTAVEKREGNERDKEWFELVVTIKTDRETYTVTNARGGPRTWSQVNTLIKFLRETCPNFVSKRFQAGEPALDLIFGVTSELTAEGGNS